MSITVGCNERSELHLYSTRGCLQRQVWRIAPWASPVRGAVSTDDYATLIDPTDPAGEVMPTGLVTPHPSPLPQGERGRLPWCNALRLVHPTLLPQGESYRGRLRFANRPYSTRFDLTNCPKRLIHMGVWPKPRGLTGTPVEGATLAPWRRGGRPAGLRERRYRP